MCISHRCARDCSTRHTNLGKYILFFLLCTRPKCVCLCRALCMFVHDTRSNLLACPQTCRVQYWLKMSSSLLAFSFSRSNKIYTQFYDYFDILLWSSSSYSTISLHPVWVLYVFCVPDTFSFYYYYYDCSHEYN